MSAHASTRTLVVLAALGYTAFVTYGSLVPLDFRPTSFAQALDAFVAVLLDPARGSRIDWATNVVLAIPLAFFWAGVLASSGSIWRRVWLSIAVFFGCLAFSIGVEFAQLFFPSRTTSLKDIAAQALGALIGLALWWSCGRAVMRWAETLPLIRGRAEIAERLLAIYLFVLLVYNVLPLDLSVSPVELYRKWRAGRVVLMPFTWTYTEWAQQVYELVTDVAIWVPVALLWRIASAESNREVWIKVVAAAAAIEAMQLFVMSRVSDTTDIVLAGLGAALGIAVAQRMALSKRAAPEERVANALEAGGSVLPWVAGLVVWFAVLAVVFWFPFDFEYDGGTLRKRLFALKHVPLYAYWQGSPLRAITEVLHKTGFFLPLGMLLAGIVSELPRRVPRLLLHVAALCIIAGAAATIEIGQLFLPRKNVDFTDWFLEVAGGFAGYAAFLFVRARWRGARDQPFRR